MNDGIWKLMRLLSTIAMLIGVGVTSWAHDWIEPATSLRIMLEITLIVLGGIIYFVSELCE